jgi:very-short-patch-repair endonuclease
MPGAGARVGEGPESGPGPTRTVRLVDGRRVRVAADLTIDARIETVAGCQLGRASREQLLAAGVAASAIKRRLRSGRLELLHRAVYGLPGTRGLPLAEETAALLACGRGAVLSHHSAATLWALRPGTARPVHITIPGEHGCPTLEGVTIHRSRILTPADVTVHRGLPVTSPARVYLDIAPGLPDRDLERLLDEGLFAQRIVTRAQFDSVLKRAGGHPGRARLARVAHAHANSTSTDSPPEELLFEMIRAAGLPEPRTRFPMLGYALDFYWPGLQLAVEVDAYGTHGSRARFEADRRRDARLLTERGVETLRVTKAAVEQRPAEALGLVARAIGQRERVLRGPRTQFA